SQSIATAAKSEARRHAALERMEAELGAALSGGMALRWRNAGRFMPASDHADLIEAALSDKTVSSHGQVRLGIVGSPLASIAVYEMLETFGPVVCDLQPWGSVWPGPGNTNANLDGILRAAAGDPSCPRIAPSSANRASMVAALVS